MSGLVILATVAGLFLIGVVIWTCSIHDNDPDMWE
jgi:Na+-transporting NADH:ubiquinone oxidoreductase subunit NqrD